jgi:hypothetical protein
MIARESLISIKALGAPTILPGRGFLFGTKKQAAQIAPRGRPRTAMFGAEISDLHCEGDGP